MKEFFNDLDDKTIIINNKNKEDKKEKKFEVVKISKKKSKKKVITINIEEELLNKLKEIAEEEERSVSSLVNKILKDYVKNYNK